MAAISALTSFLCCRICRETSASFHPSFSFTSSSPSSSFSSLRLKRIPTPWRKPLRDSGMTVRAIAEEETLAPEEEEVEKESTPSDQPVSVPVSPSDMLTMFFKAEGTMDESAVSTVSKALQGIESISDLKVQIVEGIASVELTKQTTVQATGVA